MNDKIKELVKLSEENPDMEIVVMVDYEVCTGAEEHAWWKGEIEKIEKDIQWNDGCGTIFTGEDDIREQIEYNAQDDPDLQDMEDKQFQQEVDKEFNRLVRVGKIKEVIIIYVGV